MAEIRHGTAIEWTHGEGRKGETWNPVTGCSKVSPGCAHCYAETLAKRLHRMGQHGYTSLPWTPENALKNVFLHPDRLDQPLRWSKPRMIFVNSMSDLFHELVPDDYIAQVYAVMAHAPQHTFQCLTKRPERMQSLLSSSDFPHTVARAWDRLVVRWEISAMGAERTLITPDLGFEWPLPNCWAGVSIENRQYVHRADLLRETPAAVRFISAEPLLGPLVARFEPDGDLGEWVWPDGKVSDGSDVLDLTGIDWLIVGGESGAEHRLMDLNWVRDLRNACLAQRTPFFFKQVGGRTPKAGGRVLDGRTWDEMPR
jgi:protein gp37